MVMGDVVPLDREVPAGMARLFRGGLEVLTLFCNVTGDIRL